MRASVSRRYGGMKVHATADLSSAVVDELEPGFVVDVLKRNPPEHPDRSYIAFERRFTDGTRVHRVGWCKTALLVFDWERAAPAPPSPPPQPPDPPWPRDLVPTIALWPFWLGGAIVGVLALIAWLAR